MAGGSETEQYLLYLPAGASLAGGANFTRLVGALPQRQYIVRDWPAPSPAGSGESGAEGGGGDSGSSSSNSSGGYVYAVVYSEEKRNGELVVTALLEDSLVEPPPAQDPAAEAGSGEAGGGAGAGNGTAGIGGTGGRHWALLQAHSREVEIVDVTVSASHLAVLERRNGTLVAVAYALPADGEAGGGRELSCGVSACTCLGGYLACRASTPVVVPSPPAAPQAPRWRSCPRAGSLGLTPLPTGWSLGGRGPSAARCCGCGTAASRSPGPIMTSTWAQVGGWLPCHVCLQLCLVLSLAGRSQRVWARNPPSCPVALAAPAAGNRVLKQQEEVLGFDPARYLSRLAWAPSTDGAQVPLSIAYRGGERARRARRGVHRSSSSDSVLCSASWDA